MKKLYLLSIIYSLLQLNATAQSGWKLIHTFDQDIRCISFKDSLNGYAAPSRENSIIFQTSDGGINWNPKNIPNLNAAISHIIFINNNLFIGVGSNGTIIKSVDNGNTWIVKNVGDSSNLVSVCSTEDGKLFVCSSSEKIYKSIDNGESWNVTITKANILNDIAFVNSNVGFCIGDIILKTTDGGNNWFSIFPIFSGSHIATEFISETTGYIIGYQNGKSAIAKTTDEGNSWNIVYIDKDYATYQDLTTWGNNIVWVVGTYMIIKSNDGGINWSEQKYSPYHYLLAVQCINPFTCYALGSEGALYKTIDGGSAPPVLTFPKNGTTAIPLRTKLAWSSSTETNLFKIQIAEEPNFINLVYESNNIDSSIQISLPKLKTAYYWRVKDIFPGYEGAWSSPSTFATTNGVPNLSRPTDKSVDRPLNDTLSWEDVSLSASVFQLQVSADPSFNFLFYDDNTLVKNRQGIDQLSDSSLYFWRVRAKINNEWTEWSVIWSFRTFGKYSHLLFPLNNLAGVPAKVIFRWSQAAYASQYKIQISTDSLFQSNIIDQKETNDQFYEVVLNLNTKYFWRVGAKNIDGKIYWSNFWSFTTGNKYDGPLFPLNIGNKWYYQAGSTRNEFYYGAVKEITDTLSNVFREVTSKYYYQDSIHVSKEYWAYIDGKFYLNTSPSLNYADKCFDDSLSKDTCSSPYVCRKLIEYKVFNITDTAQEYTNSWLGHLSAVANKVTVFPGIGIVKKEFIANPPYTKDSTYLVGMFKDGEVFGDTILTAPLSNGIISIPVFPLNNSIKIPTRTEFRWLKKLSAVSYGLQISKESVFNNIIYSYNGLVDTSFVIDSLEYNTEYFWRVETISSNGDKYFSSIFNFTTINSPLISSPLFPLNNSNEINTTIELKWKKVPFALSYELQISEDSLLKQISYIYSGLTDTSLTIDPLDYSSKYFWRVMTVDSNNYEYWSQIWNFSTIALPLKFELYQNYPNPFNLVSKIKFDLPKPAHVLLEVYDILGREVATLLNEEKPAGSYKAEFDGSNLPSGIYFFKFQASNYSSVKKMVLIK